MDSKLSYETITQIIGRLYLESQVEIARISMESLKFKQERDQALRLIGSSSVVRLNDDDK